MTVNENSSNWENVAMVTLKSGIADFQAKFHCEGLRLAQTIIVSSISKDSAIFKFVLKLMSMI